MHGGEAEGNISRARVGRVSEYREHARFVLKILPDLDRDTVEFDKRVVDSQKATQRAHWLSRRHSSRNGSKSVLSGASALAWTGDST